MAAWWRALRGWVLLAAGLVIAYLALHFVVLRSAPIAVRVAPVDRGVVESVVTNTKAGSVRARRQATLSMERAGTIVELPHREGERINAGTVLVRLDDAEVGAQEQVAASELAAARVAVEQAQVARTDARRERDRLLPLLREGAVSEEAVDRATTAFNAADAAFRASEARVASAEAQVAAVQVARARLTLTAPIDGLIAERYVELGEHVMPGQAVLRVFDPAVLYVWAEIDEIDMARLVVGLPARVTCDPWRDQAMPGRVVRVAPLVSERLEQNRTIGIEVEIADPPEAVHLVPGVSADVEVILERTGDDAIRLPTQAILDGDRVLVITDGIARAQPFTPGLRNWEWTEVRAGLAPGTPVIVSLDREAVKAGARVQVETDPAPAAGGP